MTSPSDSPQPFVALAVEGQLQQIVDHTSAAVFVKDLEGRYAFVNREFERIKSVPAETIVGLRDIDLFPLSAHDLGRNDLRVIDERRAIDFEETVETAQGRRVYLSHKFPLFDAGGRVNAVCGIATDITDRKRSEDALRAAALAVSSAEGENVFGELVRYLAEILRVDVTMIAVYSDPERTRMRTLAARLNGKALATFDYALEGSPCRDVIGRAFHFVGEGVHPQFPPGSMFSAKGIDSYAALPLNDSAGQPLGLIAAMDRHPMRDPALAEAMLKIFATRATAEIERLRALEALREKGQRMHASEKRYRLLFEMESDAILVTDAETLDLLDGNRAAETLWGYSRDELMHMKATELSAEREATQRALQGADGALAVPLRWHRRKDGTVFPVEITLNRFVLDGRKIVLSAIRDITERRQREEALAKSEAQLRQAQKMEAIGHLTGGIAHDFNNLLTSIMGYVALAAERSAGNDSKLTKYLEQAVLSCQRARDLIQQMLTFSRPRRGEPRPLALAPLVRESVKLLRSSFPTTVDLCMDLDDDVAPVHLDPVQLEQVLMNLAINARDAINSMGEIRIAVRRFGGNADACASCRCTVEGDLVELSVTDTGSGITAAVRERMFEPFYTTKEMGRGTGMGLATVHGIVHEHGGHVLVDSVPGRGATFRVVWPALPAQDETVPLPNAGTNHALPHASLAGRIAVIDDEPSVTSFMRELLSQWGLSVTTFCGAHDALDALAADDAFDVVLTDQTMPGMTGLEFACAARSLRPDLDVVLYTGYGDGLAQSELERAGVRAVVRKPIEPLELLSVLRNLAAGSA
jgi:PAS domain S-box-containing protein